MPLVQSLQPRWGNIHYLHCFLHAFGLCACVCVYTKRHLTYEVYPPNKLVGDAVLLTTSKLCTQISRTFASGVTETLRTEHQPQLLLPRFLVLTPVLSASMSLTLLHHSLLVQNGHYLPCFQVAYFT